MNYRTPIKQLKAVPVSELPAIAKATRIGLQTLRDIKNGRGGRQTDPRLSTLEALDRYFSRKDAARHA